MGVEDILSAAASATTQMNPGYKEPLTSFQPEAPKVSMPPILQAPELRQGGSLQGGGTQSFESSGQRKRADRQALIGNTLNLVKAGSDYIIAKKQRALSMDIERLLSAQEGLNEAKASGDQEAIAKNTAIINDITSDPKKLKQLQKAFNIDLFGNGKNKQENQALQDAWKSYHANKDKDPSALNPAAQKIINSQPVRQQLSPEAQAQATAIKAGLIPKAGEVLKAAQENFKSILVADTSEKRNIAINDAAKLRADAERYHADKVYDAALERVVGQKAAAEIRMRSQVYVADRVAATWDKRLAKMDEWAKMKTGNSPIFNNLAKEAKSYNDRLKILKDENGKAQTELDKASPSAVGKFFGQRMADNADTRMLKNKILLNNLEMQQIQQNLDGVTQKMQMMDTMGIINIKELSEGSSGGGNDAGGGDDGVVDVPDEDVEGN